MERPLIARTCCLNLDRVDLKTEHGVMKMQREGRKKRSSVILALLYIGLDCNRNSVQSNL